MVRTLRPLDGLGTIQAQGAFFAIMYQILVDRALDMRVYRLLSPREMEVTKGAAVRDSS